MADFTEWAAKTGAVPEPSLTTWLKQHPEAAEQAHQAWRDGYDPDEVLRWLSSEHGLEVRDWDTLRKRLSDMFRAKRG